MNQTCANSYNFPPNLATSDFFNLAPRFHSQISSQPFNFLRVVPMPETCSTIAYTRSLGNAGSNARARMLQRSLEEEGEFLKKIIGCLCGLLPVPCWASTRCNSRPMSQTRKDTHWREKASDNGAIPSLSGVYVTTR